METEATVVKSPCFTLIVHLMKVWHQQFPCDMKYYFASV